MYEISLQTYISTLILKCEPKSGLSCRRQVVHPRPQTPQGESVAKPETPLLIILSIACKWGPWQHVQSVIRKAKSVDKNILGMWLKIETASQTYKAMHNKQRLSTSGIGQPVPGKGRPPQAIPSPISRHTITCYVRYQASKYTIIYIYIYICRYIYNRTIDGVQFILWTLMSKLANYKLWPWQNVTWWKSM